MRLLVVEDEQKLAQLVKRALTAERFSVDVALDGRQGLELAITYDYDLIVLDLLLPQLDGSEILRRVRRRDSRVPVLILTARDAVIDKVAHFEAGADDYLTKPFAMAELVVRVKALLRRGVARQENVMANSDRVLSRNMIIDHVWDQGFTGATNIVDVYVRHLRDKIGDSEQNLIRTVRGAGYVIAEEDQA